MPAESAAVPPGGYGPPGYGPPSGYGAQPGYGPPPRPKRRRALMLAITAVVAAVVAAAATGAVQLLGRGESATTMALQSGQAIASARGLALTGTIAGQSADLTVTRAGTVEGSYTEYGYPISRVTIKGVTYLKAPASFWISQSTDPVVARQADGHWAKAPPTAVNVGFGALTPGRIAHALEHAGSSPRVTSATLGRTKVIKLSAGGIIYYITAAVPNRLLRVAGQGAVVSYAFDVTPLTTTTVAPVFTILHGEVQGLRGAVDPAAAVGLLQKIHFSANCGGPTSCTVSNRVSVTDPDSARILLRMTVDFSATKGGSAFATCADVVPMAAGETARPTCGLSGSVWTGWVNSHNSSFVTWADAHFEVTVNTARDVVAMQHELNLEQGG